MDSLPTTHNIKGEPLKTEDKVLETGASIVQDFRPVKNICAHLNAFHAYADHPERGPVEANHYCSHVNDDFRQCILYDSPEPNARLIGIEYMISKRLYESLDPEERKLWHSHVFEVKSGMLIMPKPATVPEAAWSIAETKEMEKVVELYGKVYHLWQIDQGHEVPLGAPKLMTSYTTQEQMPEFQKAVADRDQKFGSDYYKKKQERAHIQEPEIHPDADQAWKK